MNADAIAGWVGPSEAGLRPGDEGSSVHLVTLDGRCMAGIATECLPGGWISVVAFPVSGMLVPNPGFLWSHDPSVHQGTGYHRPVECPRRRPA